ncbi:septum formation inhibitor Maf [Porphyromonas crevioricanis]|uniref:dTTP/UTP pyrophosphatase n=3 Tax=Porphyromonas crevioricanis TaxID=393921 RepID=A0AB34PHQ9_9PORP|nr:Maf-like protein [Porphyromonas crevioricanis]KGN90480.1 septum formation inhibitor Maf [Porphyromonas crevioricanis]KGN96923.1 septum formation inhibitor Maf [Porphyromonas crevioricanis]
MCAMLKDFLSDYQIVLASQSPRRRELLAGLDIPFIQISLPDIEEVYPDSLPLEEVPLFLSRLKATAYRERMQASTLLITADTVVIIEGEILGKPQDRSEAESMLKKLSGKEHIVVTGVSITSLEKQESFSCCSKVCFEKLSSEEIDFYLDHYRPYDKAGAYGIQEWIGYVGIHHVEGSFYNVMGLPVHLLYQSLKDFA